MINKVLPTKIDLESANVLTVMVCFFHLFQSTSSLLGDFKGPPNRPMMTLSPCPPKLNQGVKTCFAPVYFSQSGQKVSPFTGSEMLMLRLTECN